MPLNNIFNTTQHAEAFNEHLQLKKTIVHKPRRGHLMQMGKCWIKAGIERGRDGEVEGMKNPGLLAQPLMVSGLISA